MTTITMPNTVGELFEQAIARGMQPSEYLAELGPVPMPPAGFTLDPSSDGDYALWSGPTFEGKGWKVTTDWTVSEGVTFYVDGDGDNAIQGAEAAKIAAALAEVAALK
ncbi:hypothetical protein [Pseudarthrobacter sp. LMD1-1-1.1]|uniref:hypothetical protein n=1 Tax=Pseudarthrobacter sp. LMD1-1-1.1 TaxID=3135242 RepID=UPI00343436B3